MFFLITILVLILGTLAWVIKSNFLRHGENFDRITWFLIATQSLILALFIGSLAWPLLTVQPQVYPEFVSGRISFSGAAKTPEYQTLILTVTCFILLFIGIAWIYQSFLSASTNSYNGTKRIGLLSLLPAALMLGQSMRFPQTPYLLYLSALFICIFLAVLLFMSLLLRRNTLTPEQVVDTANKLFLGALLCFVSDAGIAVFISRLIGRVAYSVGWLGCLMIVAALFAVFLNKRLKFLSVNDSLNTFFFASQLGIPLLFGLLTSPPVLLLSGDISRLPYNLILPVLLIIFTATAYYDIFRRWRAARGEPAPLTISPWILVPILLVFQTQYASWPSISTDEYHSGEFYLPWWLLTEKGSLPFVDYQPARGMLNYLNGFFAWLLADNTFSDQAMIIPHINALYLVFIFLGMRKLLGNLPAFLSAASLAGFAIERNMTGQVLVTLACLSFIVAFAKQRKPVAAFWVWATISAGVTLFSVAEGASLILSTLPIAGFLLYRAWQSYRSRLLLSFGIAAAILLLLTLTTRLDEIVLGAARYLLEQSGINDVAHGIPWAIPQDLENAITIGYFWQIARFSWLLVVIPLVLQLISQKRSEFNFPNTFLLIALMIMALILIPRSAGRIDPDVFSRPGFTSIAFLLFSLPLVIFLRNGTPRWSLVLVTAIIFGLLGNQELAARAYWRANQNVIYQPYETISGSQLGLSGVGENVVMDKTQAIRQQNIRHTLDRLLTPDETYYDLTNHNADYGFQGRHNPVMDTAYYNAPSAAQQERAIAQLSEQQIPIILIEGNNLANDGGTLALRGYLQYRYLLESYLPFEDEYGYIWMVRRGEEYRLDKAGLQLTNGETKTHALNTAFYYPNLASLPDSWGKSFSTLSKLLSEPKELLIKNGLVKTSGMQQIGNWVWDVNNPNPYLIFNLPADAGRSDMLSMGLAGLPPKTPLKISWIDNLSAEAVPGSKYTFLSCESRCLVPLSSAPSWVVGPRPEFLRIDLPSDFRGSIQFTELILYKRQK